MATKIYIFIVTKYNITLVVSFSFKLCELLKIKTDDKKLIYLGKKFLTCSYGSLKL